MTKFVKYQSLKRLGVTEVEGIQAGICYVFPKLDGTNASVWLDAEGNIKAGSRNRTLSIGSDNAGFNKWVLENEDRLRKYLDKFPHHRLYGEWLVPHSLKTYRDDAWRKFYIFDVVGNEGEHIPYEVYSEELKQTDLDYLAPIAIIRNGRDEDFRACVDKNVFLIREGEGVGEGVVIKNYGWKNRFDEEIWAKVITNAFKEVHHKEMGAPEIGGISDEERIVNEYVNQHLVDKTYAKIVTEGEGWQSRFIPQLLGRVFYDLVNEELWDILKKYKNPKIDFAFLQRLTTMKIKELRKDLF